MSSRLIKPKLAVGLSQQHHPAITGHAAAATTTFHDFAPKPTKFNRVRPAFWGTVWNLQSLVVIDV